MRHHHITSELDRGRPEPPHFLTRKVGLGLQDGLWNNLNIPNQVSKTEIGLVFFPLLTVLRPQGSHHPSPAKEMFDISEQN